MIKYIAYCRKSTDDADRQVLSIEAQVTELKEYAKKENLEIALLLTESKTAKNPGREIFEQMLKLIEKGEANGIISWNPDRLARNSIDGGKIIYLLDTGKLQSLKFPTHWFENTPQGRFMLSIAFGQAKYYIDNLSENVKRGIRQKLRNGVFPSKAPLGYINEPKKKTIELDPKTAKLVRKAFQLFATGKYSYTDIDRFFFQNGIKHHSGNKYLHLERIRSLFKKTFYYGVFEYKGEIYQGIHKPLISKSLFDKCQEIINRRSKTYKNNKKEFWFLGLAKCKECGSAITAEKHYKYYPKTRGKVRYDYYRCGKHQGYCSQKYVTATDFEQQIRNIIWSVSLHPKNAKWLINRLHADEVKEKQSIEEKLALLKSRLINIEERLGRLLTGYLDQVIDTSEYQIAKKKLIEEKTTIEEEIAKINDGEFRWVELVREFINSALEAHKIAVCQA
jgi:DNA invertase Pin-like site-specific DNA recombinase